MNKFKSSMVIGHLFLENWMEETNPLDWHASEECATITKLAYKMHKILGIELEDAFNEVMYNVRENKYKLGKVEDHMYDDYAKGFIAGQKFGLPTKENMELVKKANALWENDNGEQYGYYQEVCDQINHERR